MASSTALLRFLALGVAARAVLACSSEPSASGGVGEPPPPFEVRPAIADFCTQLSTVSADWCAYIDRCCSADDKADPHFSSICVRADPSICTKGLTEDVANGRNTFHPEHAGACLDAVRANLPAPPAACSGLRATQLAASINRVPGLEQIGACRATIAGTKTAGQTCDQLLDCAEPQRCRDLSTSGLGGGIQCADVVPTGGACVLDSDCADGEVCAGELNHRTCSKPRRAGEACLLDSDCEPPLVCNLLHQVCAPLAGVGQSCDLATGQYCDYLAGCDPTSHQCVALKGPGTRCTDTAECTGRCDQRTMTCAPTCGGTR
jgi:hypothetical protein